MISIPEQRHGELLNAETLRGLVETIVEHVDPERVIVFGSYASGTPTPDSDLDLLVVMETDRPHYKRSVPLRRLFPRSPCAMDLLVYTPEEFDRWKDIVGHVVETAVRTGRTVYER